jgi:hypothetical protein
MNNIIVKRITVARSAYYCIGVKLWFVVQDADQVRYQRWSYNMDKHDEVLMIVQPGDVIDISFELHPDKNVLTAVEFA